MAVVGSAEIVVRAITNRVRDDIKKSLNDALPDVRQAGADAGKGYGEGFGKNVADPMRRGVDDALNRAGVNSALAGDRAGSDYGRAAGRSATREMGNADFSGAFSGPMDRATRDGTRSIQNGARDWQREAEAGGRSAGNRGGNAFGIAISNKFKEGADRASSKLTVLIATGNTVGVAIAGLVSAASAAVSGLFALGAAASQAAGAIAVLPGTISVAAQALGALKLAFSGVGKAISAGFKPVTPTAQNAANAARHAAAAVVDAQQNLARAHVDAARSISQAQHNVAEAYRSAAIASANAARAVQDAERTLAASERDLTDARRELNAAYREGAEQLQQLAFDAEDAALAEERAGLRLQDAQAAMVAAQSLPADDRARIEAELSYKEAELAYREAKDRTSDLKEEQKTAAREGVKGTDAVVSAQDRVNSAIESVADAERGLADARRSQAQTHHDNIESIRSAQEGLAAAQLAGARSVADAEEALREARQAATEAQDKATASVDAYGAALDKLSGPAAAFVQYIVSLKDEFDALKASAGELLFPKLTSALQLIVANIFPVLEDQLRVTGGLIGDMALSFARTISTGEGLSRFKKILSTNNDMMKIFTERTSTGRSAVGNLVIVALRLLDVIQPITRRFFEWIRSLTVAAEKATDTKKEMQGLRDFFKKAGDTAAQLGHIFHNLWDIIMALGHAATPAGQSILDAFEKATGKFAEFLNKPKQQKELKAFFKSAAKNFLALSHLIGVIIAEFLKLGDNPGIRKFAKGIEPAVKILGDVGDRLTNAGPQLAELGVQVARLIKAFTSTGAIQAFLTVLTKIVKAMADMASSPIGQKILLYVGLFAAFSRSIALVLMPIKFLAKALIGGPLKALGGLGKVLRILFPNLASFGTIIGRLIPIFLRLAGPIGLVIATIPVFIHAIKRIYAESPELRKFIDNAVKGFKALFEGGKEAGNWLGKVLPPILAWVKDAFDKYLDKIVIPIINNLFHVINKAMPVIASIIKTTFTVVKWAIVHLFIPWWKHGLLPAVKLFINIMKLCSKIVIPLIKGIFAVIKFVITRIFVPWWKFLMTQWRVFVQLVKIVVDRVKEKWNDMVAKIKSLWESKLRPVLILLMGKFQDLKDRVKEVINNIKGKWDELKEKMIFIKGKIIEIVNNIKDKFGEIKDAVGRAFNNLGAAAKGDLNDFIRFINQHLIDNINRVTSKFGMTIQHIQTFAQGGRPKPINGRVRGPGGPTDDRVPAMVSPDEYIIRARAARAIGYDRLGYANTYGRLPPRGDRNLNASGSASGMKDGNSLAGIFGLDKGWNTWVGLAEQGVGKVLSTIILGAKGLVPHGTTILDKFVKGVLDTLAEKAKSWGADHQDKANQMGAPVGGGGADIPVISPSNPRATQYWHGGKFTRLFIAHLTKAQQVAGVYIPVTQGGFRPYTSYSGSTHAMDAIDTAVNYKILYALRRVGIAAGDRTGLGNWSPHVHGVPGPGAGYGSATARSQWADYVRRGGRKQSARSPWGLAVGGLINPRSGGINAIIGEGSRPERVEPLDREGFSRRDRAILEAVREAIASRGSGDKIEVHPSKGMDEVELANLILRKMAWRGAGT